MVTDHIESIPQLWDEARDGTFFHVVARVFSTEFLNGAGLLLALNDSDEELVVATAAIAGAETDLTVVDVRPAARTPEKA